MFRRYKSNPIAMGFYLIILFWIFIPINPKISFIGLGIVLLYHLIIFALEQDLNNIDRGSKDIDKGSKDDDDW